MDYRWTNWCYDWMRPVIGHRAAMGVANALPAVAFAGGGLLLFWLLIAVDGPGGGGGGLDAQCGSGFMKWDC